MNRRNFMKAVAAGIISGLALGFFLKMAESLTGMKVYTLLLNVDYVPVLNRFRLPEWGEFSLHLVISVLLSIVLYFYQRKYSLSAGWVVKISLAIGLLLYPTTLLSERTPGIFSGYAFFLWMTGHGIFGIILGWLLKKPSEQKA